MPVILNTATMTSTRTTTTTCIGWARDFLTKVNNVSAILSLFCYIVLCTVSLMDDQFKFKLGSAIVRL
jgi:hypothetical protein